VTAGAFNPKEFVRRAKEQMQAVEVTEDGLALVFAERFSEQLRYCHHHGAWFVWDGQRWAKEETKLAFHCAREVVREFNIEGKALIAKTSTAAGVERFAQADRAFALTSEVWDRDPFLLGTPAGTVDLRTGELRPSQQAAFITKATAVAPGLPGTQPMLWLRFLEDATRGDADLIRFLQQIAGYGLTGDTREHALFFIHGAGGNGKGVFVNTIIGLLGDYAQVAAMETFTASNSDRHPTDLAMLRSARVVTAQETEEGRRWAEARIKALTGGDPITARFMRRDFFTYTPQFKLVIVGNYKPLLRSVGDAERRRFNIVPFTHKPTVPDPELPDKLRAEWPAILRWAIEGALDWQTNGLLRPAVVTEATNAYFDAQNLLGQWLEERCETDLSKSCFSTSSDLYKDWRAYAEAAGEHPGSQKSFGDELEKQGFERGRVTGGTRGYRGIGLRYDPAEAGISHD
jgi:putative DNA primase/helicase